MWPTLWRMAMTFVLFEFGIVDLLLLFRRCASKIDKFVMPYVLQHIPHTDRVTKLVFIECFLYTFCHQYSHNRAFYFLFALLFT